MVEITNWFDIVTYTWLSLVKILWLSIAKPLIRHGYWVLRKKSYGKKRYSWKRKNTTGKNVTGKNTFVLMSRQSLRNFSCTLMWQMRTSRRCRWPYVPCCYYIVDTNSCYGSFGTCCFKLLVPSGSCSIGKRPSHPACNQIFENLLFLRTQETEFFDM